MIDARELRIGNYVLNDESIPTTVNLLGKTLVSVKNSKKVNEDDWKPIPLTEGLLLKCGFDKKSIKTKAIKITINYFQLNNIVVYLVKDFFEIEVITAAGQFNLFNKWHNLHQLQNLYFALTGEELEVNL